MRHRILIYGMNYWPEPTGVGRYTGELAAYLAEHGMDVDVVAAIPHYPGWAARDGYSNQYAKVQTSNLTVFRCPILLRADMRGIWRLLAPLSFAISSAPVLIWRLLSKRPHAILCVEPTLFAAPIAIVAGKFAGVRLALHVQDLEVDAAFAVNHLRGSLLRRFATLIERFVLRRFDTIVTISGRMRDALVKKGVSSAQLAVVRNWVWLDRIFPMARSPLRDEWGIPDDSFVCLYAGNIGAKQALEVMLDAAARLSDEQKILFVVAGDGPEKKRLMERFGHLPNVRFMPVQPEGRLCDLLNLADIHVLPQLRDAADLVLPSKLGGILASGRPCLLMADPGTELFEFMGQGGLIVAPGESVALATAIQRASRDPSYRIVDDNSARLAQLSANSNLRAFADLIVRPSGSELRH